MEDRQSTKRALWDVILSSGLNVRGDLHCILLKVKENYQCSPISSESPGGSMSQVVRLPTNSYKPITNTAWVCSRLCKLQKGCTRLAPQVIKVYQLLAHGRWFSPFTSASSTTKTVRHDIAEILLKVTLNTKNQSTNKFSVVQ